MVRHRALGRPVAITATVMAFYLVTAVEAETAFAGAQNYCGQTIINPGTLCRGSADRHRHDFNQASYLGGGTVAVCEKVVRYDLDRDSQYGVPSYVCGNDYAGDSFNATTYLTYPYVQNADDGRHTINGYAEW